MDKKSRKSEISAEEIEANNRIYLARQDMYRTYGYDNEKERLFIIGAGWPVTGKILEAGTGKGYLTLELAKKGYELVTYDVDPAIQRLAKMNLAYYGVDGGVEFVIEGRDKLSFSDGSFNVVFCVNTLHHLSDTAAVIDELTRVMSDNGKLILSDFTEKTFEIMDRVHASEGGAHEVIGWSMDKTAEYLKDRGFTVSETADNYQRVFIIKRNNK